MKGRVKIELRDKDGNIVSSQEKDNLVTNFIDDMYVPMAFSRSFVGAGHTYLGSGYHSSHEESTSGRWMNDREDLGFFDTIQLFDDYLTNDANDYFFGDENVVGLSRYGLGYSGSNPLYGTSNGAETGWNSSRTEYTYVYDWSTAAANGTIKSIALSPIWSCLTGGGVQTYDDSIIPSYIGESYYNLRTISGYHRFKYGNYNPSFIVADYENNYILLSKYPINENNNFVYDENSDTYYFKLYKVRCPLSKIYKGYELTGTNNNINNLILEEISITMKNPVHGHLAADNDNDYYNSGHIRYHNGKIYAVFYKNDSNGKRFLYPGESITITVYDLQTQTEEFITLTNNVEGYGFFNINSLYFVGDNKLAIESYVHDDPSSSSYYYASPLLIDFKNQEVFPIKNYYSKNTFENRHYKYEGTHTWSFHAVGDSSHYAYAKRGDQYYKLNTLTGEVKRVSARQYSDGGVPILGCPESIKLVNSDPIYAFATGATIFTTKFNLDEPIVKNNEQSLKVTYTLRFDDY